MKDKTYIAIDLKSFYASVECRERGLDPLDTNLVVADESRTDKTICLAVTPSLKSYGTLTHLISCSARRRYASRRLIPPSILRRSSTSTTSGYFSNIELFFMAMPSYFLSRTLRHKYEDRPGDKEG